MARVISPDELLTRGVARGEIYSYVENVRRFIARVEVAFVSWRERERECVFSRRLLVVRGGCYSV